MVRFSLALLAAAFVATGQAGAAEKTPIVHVLLWFDTEDYILPASDDAALKVAEWLRKEEVTATFKVVGEKARTLEKRGRKDVIEALKKHEIGYHSNYHSVQPTPAMYMSALGWDEGVAEFDRREKPGYDDVKRIFGQTPSCYGQPGSSWGPQSYGTMRKWGMPMYLDYAKHMGIDGKAHFYGGVFNILNYTNTTRSKLEGEGELQKAQDKFVEVHKRVVAEGGGVVSIYYHPCEFVHNQFWDGANFEKGANPPREQWKLPLAKSPEESKAAYESFYAYIRFIKRFAEVKFITASQAFEMHKDKAIGREFTVPEIKVVAEGVAKGVNFQTHGDYTLAPSEILKLLNDYLVEAKVGPPAKSPGVRETPFGPSEAPRAMPPVVTTDASQFVRTARDVHDFMNRSGRVPSTVWLGSQAVTPEAYLAALAKVVVDVADGKPVPETIELTPAKLETEKNVSADDPKLWAWVIFPKGFDAPGMMALAKRQAWTIKPAIYHSAVKK